MIVIPIVVSSLIIGVAGAGSGKQVGKLGFRTILYFEIITTFAIILGLALANLFQPGQALIYMKLKRQISVNMLKQKRTKRQIRCGHIPAYRTDKLLPIIRRRSACHHLLYRAVCTRHLGNR